MNALNGSLRNLLINSRNKAGYDLEAISKELSIPIEEIKIWEEFPIKIPLCEFVKVLYAYKISELDFVNCTVSMQIKHCKL